MVSYVGTDGSDNLGYGSVPDADNTVYGLGGNDTIYAHFAGYNYVYGGSGNDMIYLQGSQVTGGAVYGGSGNSFISALATQGYGTGNTFSNMTSSFYLDGGTGFDTLIGAGSADTIVGNGADSMVGSSVLNSTNEFYDLWYGSTTMVGGSQSTNYFHASGGSDSIIGGNKTDSVWLTHYGFDTFIGGSGTETIYADNTSDTITLGNGNDTVWASNSDYDTIYGGTGNDVYFIGGTLQSSITQLQAGSGNDTIDAADGKGVLYIQPGTGTGTNIVTGDNYSNHIYGQFNNGTLYERGGTGVDELVGGKGSNTFIGGGGGDFITGGGLANSFDFNGTRDGNLHINNFNVNTDHIGLSAAAFGAGLYGGETLTAGFNLINGTASVANTATLLYSQGLLYFDADGTGAAAPTLLAGLSNTPATLSVNNFFISGTNF